MAMLNARLEECEATLERERMILEIVFRLSDTVGDWIYWLEVAGQEGEGLDETIPIDRMHQSYARRCKEPGWEEAEPQFLPEKGPSNCTLTK
jgi:Family of unknown function (DUF6176)